MKNVRALVLLAITVFVINAVDPSLVSKLCTGTTCSPNWCASVSNSACVDPLVNQTADIQVHINSLGCRQCQQSQSSFCTSDYLKKVLKTSGGLALVYCNDEYLVLHSDGFPNHATGLQNIPHPPGSGGSLPYFDQCVTRSHHRSHQYYKVLLNPVELPTATPLNNMPFPVNPAFPGSFPDIGLPSAGPLGVSISGLSIYPYYDNAEGISYEQCEVDQCSAHAGQDFDYHYHGDPYSNVSGTCLYSQSDYGNNSAHPPLIGWGLDGFMIYGRHLSMSNVGAYIPLDLCGGHNHTDVNGTPLGYHYHSQVLNETGDAMSQGGSGKPYYGYVYGPYQCWRGNITAANFWVTTSGSGPPGLASRSDADNLRPCCQSTQYYAASGYYLPSAPSTKPTSKPTVKPSARPSSLPTAKPTAVPTARPTAKPTAVPTARPSAAPTARPSAAPTAAPTALLVLPVVPTAPPSTTPLHPRQFETESRASQVVQGEHEMRSGGTATSSTVDMITSRLSITGLGAIVGIFIAGLGLVAYFGRNRRLVRATSFGKTFVKKAGGSGTGTGGSGAGTITGDDGAGASPLLTRRQSASEIQLEEIKKAALGFDAEA